MARFLAWRLLNMIPLIIGITFISFLAMSLVPGDYLSNLKMNPKISPEVIHQLQAQFGLDKPLLVRYLRWLWGVLHLNFGYSLKYRVSVTSLIARARVQYGNPGGGQHDILVDARDSDRNRGRRQAELDLGSGPVLPRVFRDVGAELLPGLPDGLFRDVDGERLAAPGRHILGRLHLAGFRQPRRRSHQSSHPAGLRAGRRRDGGADAPDALADSGNQEYRNSSAPRAPRDSRSGP